MKKWKKWAAATMAGMMAASTLKGTGAAERDTGSRRKFWPAGNSQIFLVGQ